MIVCDKSRIYLDLLFICMIIRTTNLQRYDNDFFMNENIYSIQF